MAHRNLPVSVALGSVSGGSYCCPGCGTYASANGARFGRLGPFGELALHCRKCANSVHFTELDMKMERQTSKAVCA